MAIKRILVTDIDNTLYNWVDYYAPSFRAMVHVIQKATALEEGLIYESFKSVFVKHRSIEYPFVVQELPIWKTLGWSKEEILTKAVHSATVAFGQSRRKNLRLYPGVRYVLKWLRQENIYVAAFTTSPLHQAIIKLKNLQIKNYFNFLIVATSFKDPETILPNTLVGRNEYRNLPFKIIETSPAESKPSPKPLIDLVSDLNISKNCAFVVGDSISQDVVPGKQAGLIDIWANLDYKAHTKNLETIRRISTITEEERENQQKIAQSVRPTFTIRDFRELIGIVQSPVQYSLGL